MPQRLPAADHDLRHAPARRLWLVVQPSLGPSPSPPPSLSSLAEHVGAIETYHSDPEFYALARESDIATVLLATELSSEARLREIAAATTGFLYYVPRIGITGLDLSVTTAVRERIASIRSLTDKPVCVGIGVKARENVRRLAAVADGVIVGTRIVEFIDANRDRTDLPARLAGFVRELMP